MKDYTAMYAEVQRLEDELHDLNEGINKQKRQARFGGKQLMKKPGSRLSDEELEYITKWTETRNKIEALKEDKEFAMYYRKRKVNELRAMVKEALKTSR